MKSKILAQITVLFQKYFNNKKIKIKLSTSAKNIKEWDSLAQVGLIILIEKKYNIKFSVNEVNNLSNIGEMIELIYKKKK
jgi:acyl carrier protein